MWMVERRLVTGGLSLKATMPSKTTRRHCLPCLKPDGTRTYQTTQTTCPGANLTAFINMPVIRRPSRRAETRRPGG